MRIIGTDRQISVINCGSRELSVNGEYFSIPFSLGCAVNQLPIFHLTNSHARYEERRQLIPDLEHIPQDEASTDGFDVAALIAQAMDQKEWSAGADEVYKAHVIYPTASYEKLVLLTGWVPYATVTALQEGRAMLQPITLSREVIHIPTNPDCDWKEIDLFQIIAGLIDEGAKLSAV
ncbi:hypothetical protein C0992_008387 [Termitomyces sp. T32_za158]|nr:hypothetical protein C0992_008387 [Termitomyces sp. T32_za158]